MRFPSTRTVVTAALVAVAYFVAGRFGLLFAIKPGIASAVWLPAGISVFAVLTWGPWMLPGVFLGSLLTNATAGTQPGVVVAIALGATAAPAAGLYLLRRFVGAGSDFRQLREVVALLLFGATVPAIVSAVAGSVIMLSAGLTTWAGLGTQSATWWLGNMSGIVIAVPLLFALKDHDLKLSGRRHIEVVTLAVLVILGSIYMFAVPTAPLVRISPFLLLPLISWVAMRLNRRAMTLIMALIAGLSIYGAVHSVGAYALGSVPTSLIGAQLMTVAVATTGLLMVATVYDRTIAKREMADTLAELEERVAQRTADLTATNERLLQEVAERLTAQADLVASKERFRLLFEDVPVGYQSLDEEGRILGVNDAWLELLGYSYEDVVGQWFGDFLVPEQRDLFRERFPKFKEAGRTSGVDFEMLRKDGTRVLMEFDGRISRTATGAFKQTHCIMRDVTEQARVAAALRESETKFRAVFEGAGVGIAIARRDGSVLDANPALEEMCGLKVAAIPQGHFMNLVHPMDRGPMAARFAAMSWTPGETTDAQEARFVRPDGTLFWGRYMGSIIEHADEPVVITMIDDVTMRKEAEAALTAHSDDLERIVHARTAQLELANKELVDATLAKDRFLAGMSHELRTPLNSILGFTGVMRQGLAGPLTDEQERQLDMVKRSGRHLLSLVDQVLDLSRIEAGHDEVCPGEFELRAFVKGVSDGLGPLADEKDLTLSVETPDAPTTVRTDEGKLRQILINVVSNALKFCEHGEVTLSATLGSDGFLRFTVEDTGPGIPEVDRPFVFDAFYQGSIPDTAKAKGTGLGLSISHNLATRLGGDITFVSIEGEGTTFVIRIPAQLQDVPSDEKSPVA